MAHDVTFHRIGSAMPAEMDKLTQLLLRRGGREAQTTADAQVILIAASDFTVSAGLLDRLGFDERKRSVLVGIEGTIDTREVPKPGSLGALLESHRPLATLAVESIRKWRSPSPGVIGSKRLAERIGCGFNKAMQTQHYAVWLNGPGESAAELVLALVAASRAIATEP